MKKERTLVRRALLATTALRSQCYPVLLDTTAWLIMISGLVLEADSGLQLEPPSSTTATPALLASLVLPTPSPLQQYNARLATTVQAVR